MPYADRERKLQYDRNYTLRRKNSGLCHDCDSPSVKGKTRCEYHLRIGTDRIMALANERKAAGLCINCGIRPLETANHCAECRIMTNNHKLAERQRMINAVFGNYGRSCECCGESIEKFLTIDHINGGGVAHRKAVGWDTYRFLWKEFKKSGSWPTDFRTLCYNCNSGRWRNGGICPHLDRNKND